ncbi:MAG: MBL fold metallo-hydrolase [Leptospiraceae bacterium]|nr:MBL fold metallo-hydrolase [Leptospiraceae bacterium]
MKKVENIFSSASHSWYIVTRDPNKLNYIIDTNEYIILNSENKAIILDPGGSEIFPVVFSSLSEEFSLDNITHIFSSHQDPDIISSISLWMDVNPNLKCYTSWLWSGFLPHFGGDDTTYISIPDEGMEIHHGDLTLEAVPAHYLHSSGNFHLYDPAGKVFFSGDVGSALLPKDNSTNYIVRDFKEHIKFAEKFHKRWMGSEKAKKNWCERVSKLEIEMLCPQHGSIYTEDNVKRFIDWFYNLEIGDAI